MSNSSGRAGSSVMTIFISIYMMALALVTLCPSIAVVGCGGILGGITGGLNGLSSGLTTTNGSQYVSNGLLAADVATGLVTLLGFLGLVLTAALVVVGIALLAAKPWAWMGSIVLNAIFIALQLALAALGNGISTIQIIFIILSGACIFLLLTNEEIKATFGRP